MGLFRKDIEKRCAYCAFGNQINGGEVVCEKRGVVPAGGSCRRFAYDPLKRVPPRPVELDRSFSEKDFAI